MNRMKKSLLLTVILSLLLLIIVACATEQVAPVTAQPAPEATAQTIQPAVETPKPAPKPLSPYDVELTPLTPAECGRCHAGVFNQIKNEGGKHKIDCTKCHTIFHSYNPVKQNWNEIMPKCQRCHGLIHGEKFAVCATCHSYPHAPKTQMPMSAEMSKVCGDCHTKVGQELQKNPSKHTKVACSACHHDKHGYIPSCMECHKPHTANQTVKDCLVCHPVHTPLVIKYPDNTANAVCGGCHGTVLNKINTTASKHGQVACAKCHTKHKYIPNCEYCHGKPHGESLLKKFPNCLQCHGDVHDLPTKSK